MASSKGLAILFTICFLAVLGAMSHLLGGGKHACLENRRPAAPRLIPAAIPGESSQVKELKARIQMLEERLRQVGGYDGSKTGEPPVANPLRPQPEHPAAKPSQPEVSEAGLVPLRLSIQQITGRPPRRENGKFFNLDNMPGVGKQLSKELVHHLAINNTIIATFVNYKYYDFAMNWVSHLVKAGVTNFLVGAMDSKVLGLFLEAGIPCFDMGVGLPTTDFGWGSSTFRKMGIAKVTLMYSMLQLKVDTLLADIDAVILRDPTPYFSALPEADILVSSDDLTVTSSGDNLEMPYQLTSFWGAGNIGFLFMRPNALAFTRGWLKECERYPNKWDQTVFQQHLNHANGNLRTGPRRGDRLFQIVDEGKCCLLVGILPIHLFLSGQQFHVQKLHQVWHMQPYSAHMTFQFSQTAGKLFRMKEMMIWDQDPPDYWNPSDGLLTYTPEVPKELLELSLMPLNSPHCRISGARAHEVFSACYNETFTKLYKQLTLVHFQLRQLRHALLLAQELGRILVMPPIACGFDRWWAQHSGVLPNANYTHLLPLTSCPLDHVLNINPVLVGNHDRPPGAMMREYSFLHNPRLDASLRSAVRGQLTAQDLAASTLEDIKTRTRQHKVLEVNALHTFPTNLVPAASLNRFYSQLKDYGDAWCCVEPKLLGTTGGGHIWYDMMWGTPHKDKFSRPQLEEPWKLFLAESRREILPP